MSGWQRSFVHRRTGRWSSTLRGLYAECSAEERQLSPAFYERALAGQGPGVHTPLLGIECGPGPLAAAAGDRGDAGLYARLAGALAGSAPPGEVDVAVSGGVDSWLLAAILRSEGYRVRAWYLETGIAGYDEREQVERSARALGFECRYVHATAADFVKALPEFISVTETPVYNLHPVSKWLLAKALHREGVAAVVTGDGADQVMRHEWDCDLLPITLTCFREAGVRIVAPFLASEVIAFCERPDRDKRPVRELARQLQVPAPEKRPTLVPPLPLPPHPRAGLPVAWDDYKTSCLSYTTGLLLETLEEERRSCVASLA